VHPSSLAAQRAQIQLEKRTSQFERQLAAHEKEAKTLKAALKKATAERADVRAHLRQRRAHIHARSHAHREHTRNARGRIQLRVQWAGISNDARTHARARAHARAPAHRVRACRRCLATVGGRLRPERVGSDR
jgi:chromosome segregation ATPase